MNVTAAHLVIRFEVQGIRLVAAWAGDDTCHVGVSKPNGEEVILEHWEMAPGVGVEPFARCTPQELEAVVEWHLRNPFQRDMLLLAARAELARSTPVRWPARFSLN